MLHVTLLGSFDVRLNEKPLALKLRPVQLLLAYLLLHKGIKLRREQLAGILWPDYTDASARKNLRNTIYRLRRLIGDNYLVADRSTVAFNTDEAYWLDVAWLEETASSDEIADLIQAAGLYRGELLPGYYEDWILWERERLQALFERLMGALVERLKANKRYDETLTWAEYWIAQGQVPEAAYRALMVAHAARDDHANMAKAYHRGREALQETLGITLSAETERLYRELRDGMLEKGPAPAGPTIQVLEKVLDGKPRPQLPRPVTTFIGRQREMDDLSRLLRGESGGRLVTIVGPGGIGKSRLSLEVAAALTGDFTDGVFFVSLAPLSDPQHIVTKISDSIGFRYPGRSELRKALLDYLQQKQLLLVMDNFDHLLAGAELAIDLLRQAPRVKILSSSRETLNLSGEAIYTLSGLDYPGDPGLPGDKVAQFGAAQLLLDRARLARPGLEVGELEWVHVGRICRQVQGMPLALVLAAGWLELLTFEEVADEIATSLDILESRARDMPPRQRSVKATFDYSWQRLAAADRQVFSRLSVFRGGFSRRAARHVADAGLRTLRILIEKSFITAIGPDRYTVHELLRQFAAEKLEAGGQAGRVRDAHSEYYLQAVAAREADLKGRRQLEALEEIESDLDNVRAAWNWALERGRWTAVDRALESLTLFLFMRARSEEGTVLFQQALDSVTARKDGEEDARRMWGRLTARSGLLKSQFVISSAEIEQEIKKSLTIAQTNQEEAEIAMSFLALGHYHLQAKGDFRQALACFEKGLDLFRAMGDLYYVAHSLHRVGYSHSTVTDNKNHKYYASQSLDLAREIGDLSDAASALGNLGTIGYMTGDYDQAEAYIRESISLSRVMGLRHRLAHDSIQLGLCEFLKGRFKSAQDKTAEGISIARDIAFSNSLAYGLAVSSLLASLQGDYEHGLILASESLNLLANKLGEFQGHWAKAVAHAGLEQARQAWEQSLAAIEIGLRWRLDATTTWVLPSAGITLAQVGQPQRAAEILGLYFNHPLRPSGWAEKWSLLNDWQTRLEDTLGVDKYMAARERGEALDLIETAEALLAEGDEAR
jgi:predicted ATPase/DNA-binding SARP family transcriptional activator/Tfp pilus assembly protein PilF